MKHSFIYLKSDEIKQNFKNFNLFTKKLNAANRFKGTISDTEDYFKRMMLLDPVEKNYELFQLKSSHIGKILKTEIHQKEISKKINTQKNLIKVNPLRHSSPINRDKKLKDKENDKVNIYNLEMIISELKSKNTNTLNTMVNLNLETTLEQETKEIKEKVRFTTSEIDKLYGVIERLRNDIAYKDNQVLHYTIKKEKFIEHYKNVSSVIYEDLNKASVKIENLREMEDYTKDKDFKDKINEYDGYIADYKKEQSFINEEINKIKALIKEHKERLTEYKTRLKDIKNKLIVHYHKILLEGYDVRKNGFVWVILRVWNIGCDIIKDYFPDYLDEISINYLFLIAKKQLEIEYFDERISEFREKIKINRERQRFPDYINDTFKTELNQLNNQQLKPLIFNITDKKEDKKDFNNRRNKAFDLPEISTYKNIVENIVKPHKVDKDTKGLMHTVDALEKQKEKIKQSIANATNEEIYRLHDEFINFNYAERFKTNLEVVLKALVGNDNYNKAISMLVAREKKILEDKNKIKL